MERADLEMVLAIQDGGSLGHAAQALHTAQPALSRRLANLERELGGRLFDRGRHGARATPAGRVLAERSRTAVDALLAAERDGAAACAGRIGVLRIGTAPTLGADLLPPALAQHHASHPDVTLELSVSGDSPGLRSRVAEGQLDMAVAVLGGKLEQGLRVATSAPQTIVVALPTGHPLAAKARVRRRDLIDQPMVALSRGEGLRAVLDELFSEIGAQPTISLDLAEREMLMPLVAAGLGATVLPERFARQRVGDAGAVELRPLSPPMSRVVGAVVRTDQSSPLVTDFVETLRHTWPKP